MAPVQVDVVWMVTRDDRMGGLDCSQWRLVASFVVDHESGPGEWGRRVHDPECHVARVSASAESSYDVRGGRHRWRCQA